MESLYPAIIWGLQPFSKDSVQPEIIVNIFRAFRKDINISQKHQCYTVTQYDNGQLEQIAK